MTWRRALFALLIAAIAGTAGGIVIARLSREAPPGDVVGLGRTAAISGPAGTLTLAVPEDWFAGSAQVNCETSPDVHGSTEDVVLASLTVQVGQGRTCTAELDPSPLSERGAYITATFYQVPETTCGSDIPTEAPASLEAMEEDQPSRGLLREFEAEGAYDPFEWRHATWCVGGGHAIRLETFLGSEADPEVAKELDVAVRALEFKATP